MSSSFFRRIRFPILIALLLSIFALSGLALAHALLVRSDPAANSSVDVAPPRVNLWFTEALEPSFSRVQVFGSNGRSVDQNDSRVESGDPQQMSVGLGALSKGVYTVAWRASSMVDGHVTKGVFTFGVGTQVAAGAQASTDTSSAISFAGLASRWLNFVGAVLLIGALAFRLWVWRPVQRRLSIETDESLLARQAWIGGLVLLVATLAALFVQVTTVSDSDLLASILNGALGSILLSTRFGAITLARIALSLIVLIVLPKSGRLDQDRRARWALIVSIGLLLTSSLITHGAARPDPTLPVIADWLHLIANTIWIGGLILFAWLLHRIRQWPDRSLRAQTTTQLVPRFSVIGLSAVSTLAITGTYAALLNVGTPDNLFGTPYGQTLLIKIILFLGLIALGAFNLLYAQRRLNATAAEPDRSLRPQLALWRSIRLEISLAAIVLLVAAVLGSLPPAQSGADQQGLVLNQSTGDLNVTLQIDPGQIGSNTFNVRLSSGGSQPIADAKRVTIRFMPPSADLGENVAEAASNGGGQYSVQGNFLSLVGAWQIEVAVQRANAYDAFARFTLNLSSGGAATAVNLPWDLIAALLAILVGVAYALAAMRLMRSKVARGLIAIGPGLIVGVIGISLTLGALETKPGELVNPIQPDARSLAAGRQLYEQHCFVCHGETGKGDGPAALRLNPRPVDLRQHMIPGVHPDSQIFDWITNGYVDTAMPAFGPTLSDNERWDLLNYIRTFGN